MHTVETARMLLRPFTPADAEPYWRVIGRDPDVRRYLPGGKPITLEEAHKAVARFVDYEKRDGFSIWAAIDRASGEFVGQCGLLRIGGAADGPVELAYAFGKTWWGQGLATEGGHASLRYGFEVLKLDQIIAMFVAENTASERVMIKLGMQRAGVIRAYKTELPKYAMTRAQFQPGAAHYRLITPDAAPESPSADD